MKNLKYLFLLLFVPAILMTSCKDDTNTTTPETKTTHKVLTEYLVANNMDLPTLLDGWIKGAPTADAHDTFVGTHNIIDIRSTEDFNKGHITGAVSSTLAGIITTATGMDSDKPFLVVCYTGQSAGHGSMALLLSGYESYVLKWGMCGWHSDLSTKWETNAKQYDDLSNWSATKDLTDPVVFSEPTVTFNSTDGKAILESQVESMLAGGLAGVTQANVLGTPSNYFINNYWAETDVDTYGNIKTAYRINPLSIGGGEIYNLDPAKDVVTYCWTGQTSSMITAYLKVLGYKSYSLYYGANSIIYDNLQTHQFTVPTVDLPLTDPTTK